MGNSLYPKDAKLSMSLRPEGFRKRSWWSGFKDTSLYHALSLLLVLILVSAPLIGIGIVENRNSKHLRYKLHELCNEDVYDPAIVEKSEELKDSYVVLCTTGEKRWVRELRKTQK